MTLPLDPDMLAQKAALLYRLEMREEALAVLEALVIVAPERVGAWNDLGNVLSDLRRYDEAYTAYRQAIALAPDSAEAKNNLGNALMLTFAFQDAEGYLRQAIAQKPGYALAHTNLGDALLAQGRSDEALTAFRDAIRLAPENPAIHLHYANALFLTGHLKEAFAESEWRWKARLARQRPDLSRCPLFGWNGEPLKGRTIRLYAEQGYGDAIQFARYAPMVAERGGHVVLLVRKGVGRLLATVPGVEKVEEFDQEGALFPGRDCDVSLMTLPHIFATDIKTVPAAIPYVSADPKAVKKWRSRLAALPGLKVGLTWAGNPRPDSFECSLIDSRRSIPLADFQPLGGVADVSLVSLQKGPGAEQEAPPGLKLFDVMDELTDFFDTAALVEALDLVIAVDTSVAHLAGALGKPVWILSRYDGCWRWMQEREDSPWYPTARLFRQDRRDDWNATIGRLTDALAEFARDRAGQPISAGVKT